MAPKRGHSEIDINKDEKNKRPRSEGAHSVTPSASSLSDPKEDQFSNNDEGSDSLSGLPKQTVSSKDCEQASVQDINTKSSPSNTALFSEIRHPLPDDTCSATDTESETTDEEIDFDENSGSDIKGKTSSQDTEYDENLKSDIEREAPNEDIECEVSVQKIVWALPEFELAMSQFGNILFESVMSGNARKLVKCDEIDGLWKRPYFEELSSTVMTLLMQWVDRGCAEMLLKRLRALQTSLQTAVGNDFL